MYMFLVLFCFVSFRFVFHLFYQHTLNYYRTEGTTIPNTDTLRGKAMEAIALMGQAVGLEVFRADAHQVQSIGIQLLVVMIVVVISEQILLKFLPRIAP